MTCGPVMKSWAWRVWMMKSVSAGAIGRAAGARPADQRDLRHHARQQHVGVEDLAVARQRVDAFLHARAARVVDEDEGRAGLQGHVHDVGDLLGVRLARRAAGDGEVLAGEVHEAASDRGGTGDHAISGQGLSGHAEERGAVGGEEAGLVEAVGVDQRGDAFACRELAGLALLVEALDAAAELGLGAAALQVGDLVLHGVHAEFSRV